MKNRIKLFWPDNLTPESDTFQIEYGKQMTITAIGLEDDEEVTFQMVHVPAIDPDKCACPPGKVELPSVAAYTTLKCCGKDIKLTKDNPVVILDNPQRMLLRAVLDADDPDGIWVWAIESDTHNINDRLRGCGCDGGLQ